MKRSERLEKINAINQGMENLAGVSLASVQADYDAQLHQLEQLRVYREEYVSRLRQRLANYTTARQLQDYHYFFSTIDKAIEQQERQVQHCLGVVEQHKAVWQQRHQEVRKMDIATENLKRSEAAGAQRREQKQTDEMASLLFGPSNGLAYSNDPASRLHTTR
ncbi:MAG TPA: flagellar export protein FliJ [Hyphomicrobiales bacterium]|nr:flagellar export protein FliJ [Hyphomicrobiales bacterium]